MKIMGAVSNPSYSPPLEKKGRWDLLEQYNENDFGFSSAVVNPGFMSALL